MREKIGKNKKIIQILLISVILLFVLTSHIYAINPSEYNPGNTGSVVNGDKLTERANVIIGALQIIGTVVSVVALGILGIKYMLGSVEEKAEYKKTLKPYIIGAIMVFGITNILAIVVTIAIKI